MRLNDPNFKCKNCVYWTQIYVHPWSETSEKLKNGFGCLLALDPEFINSFSRGTGVSYDEDKRVEVLIGKTDSCGCECLTEKDKYRLVVRLEKKDDTRTDN